MPTCVWSISTPTFSATSINPDTIFMPRKKNALYWKVYELKTNIHPDCVWRHV